MSRVVEIDSVEPGMVLAEPVVNRRGQMLLGPGASLSERTISNLKGAGVRSLIVQGEDDTLTEEDLACAEALLRGRMQWETEHPLEEALFTKVVEHLARQGKR